MAASPASPAPPDFTVTLAEEGGGLRVKIRKTATATAERPMTVDRKDLYTGDTAYVRRKNNGEVVLAASDRCSRSYTVSEVTVDILNEDGSVDMSHAPGGGGAGGGAVSAAAAPARWAGSDPRFMNTSVESDSKFNHYEARAPTEYSILTDALNRSYRIIGVAQEIGALLLKHVRQACAAGAGASPRSSRRHKRKRHARRSRQTRRRNAA